MSTANDILACTICTIITIVTAWLQVSGSPLHCKQVNIVISSTSYYIFYNHYL